MGRPGVLQYMVSLRVGYNRMTEQKQHNPPTREFSSIQLLSHVQLLGTPCTAALQASPLLTISHSLPKFMSLALLMASIHLIPLTPYSSSALNLSQHQGLFQRFGSSHQVTKILEFQLQYHSFQSVFRVDFPSD